MLLAGSQTRKVSKTFRVLGVNDLIFYAETHFETEEKYFEQFGYPDAEAHIAEHSDFVKAATSFQNDFARGKATLSIEIMDFLCDWLENHITGSDKKYTKFFNQQGLR